MKSRTNDETPAGISWGYGSPRWSGEITDCSVPVTFDQYSMCSYGCLYCFSRFQRARHWGHDLKAVNPERFKAAMLDERSQFHQFFSARHVMQWGGLADPFDQTERKHGIGLQILRVLKDLDYPITFSTKGTWWTEDDRYAELFKGQKNWNVKVSIITSDQGLATAIEPRVPTVEGRLAAIERIASWSCGGATLRLRPFILGASNRKDGHLTLINQAAARGATAVSTEFLCVEQRSYKGRYMMMQLGKIIGYDIYQFYKKHSSGCGYLRLNRQIKQGIILGMQSLTHSCGMRFYVSDAHFKELCDNGSCCGLPASWNYVRGQWCEALQIAKSQGTVQWDDISGYYEHIKKVMFNNAQGFNTTSTTRRNRYKNFTMYDYLRSIWNDVTAGQNPAKMYEVLEPVGRTDAGDLIYRYKGDAQ